MAWGTARVVLSRTRLKCQRVVCRLVQDYPYLVRSPWCWQLNGREKQPGAAGTCVNARARHEAARASPKFDYVRVLFPLRGKWSNQHDAAPRQLLNTPNLRDYHERARLAGVALSWACALGAADGHAHTPPCSPGGADGVGAARSTALLRAGAVYHTTRTRRHGIASDAAGCLDSQ